jgi:hypothetical protein
MDRQEFMEFAKKSAVMKVNYYTIKDCLLKRLGQEMELKYFDKVICYAILCAVK